MFGIDDAIIGGIISGAGSLAGGILGNQSNEKINSSNISYQRQFAQKGIQWKVKDAREAGVHPLYALGAPTIPFQPSSVGNDYSYLGKMGQNIDRAIAVNKSKEERSIDARIKEEQLKGIRIENMHRLKSLNDSYGGNSPAVPHVRSVTPNDDGVIEGANTGSNSGVEYPPVIKTPTTNAEAGASPGASPALQVVNMPGGGKQVYLSKTLQEQFEDGVTAEFQKALFDLSKILAVTPPKAVKDFYRSKGGRYRFKKIWTSVGPAWKAYKIKSVKQKDSWWTKEQQKNHDFKRSLKRPKLPGVGRPTIRGY